MVTMSLRKITGYIILSISLIAWAALPIIPFIPLGASAKAAWGGGVFIFAEITWWLAVVLLGKEIVQWFGLQWKKSRESIRKYACRDSKNEEK